MLKHTVCNKKLAELHIAVTVCFVTVENLGINKKNYSIFAWYVACVACDKRRLVTHLIDSILELIQLKVHSL